MLVTWLLLAALWAQCFAINVPDVYQESILRRYRSYGDVSVFHYYVPSQVTRATWEFAAFMDDPGCTPRQVYIHIQPGSYPVVNPDNSSFPEGTYLDQEQHYVVTTVTKFQSHDALVFHAFNPTPGSWFAVAYIPDWNDDIAQQGLSHRCRYSLGSIASWSQHPDVMLLTPHVPTSVESSSQFTYFKFFVPENIWLLEVAITNCTIQALGIGDEYLCVQGFGLQADSLPFPVDVNVTVGGTFLYNQPQPRMQTYYYLLVTASSEISFTVSVNMKECVYVWGSSLFQEPSNLGVSLTPSSLRPSASPVVGNGTAAFSSSSSLSLLTSRHSNQSVSQDWQDALSVTNHTGATNGSGSSSPPGVRRLSPRAVSPAYLDDQMLTSEQECLPMISMARIKHAQDFTDSFLLQGKDRYTSLLGVSDSFPVILKLELLPFVDIGGTLQIGAKLVEPPVNSLDQVAVIRVCVSQGQPPAYVGGGIVCSSQRMSMSMSTAADEQRQEAIRYFPFPRPGQWFVSFQTSCYVANTTLTSNSSVVPCHFDLLMVYLNIRVQPCLFEGTPCANRGVCEENHRGQFFFSTCRCVGGWRGWGCTDGSRVVPHAVLLMKTLLLTLSNLFFVPAVVLATKRCFYTEAIVYAFTMLFSTFYHACDEDLFAFCLMKYEVLQFCDFYCAILSFWVTLIAMANLPSKLVSIAHMLGALGIALGVEYQRTGLWVFVIPVGTGVLIMMLSWGKRCRQSKVCHPCRLSSVASLTAGTLLAVTGLCLFAFIETESNYKYVHSVWHVIIALSVVFLLPQAQQPEPWPTGSPQAADSAQQCSAPTDDSELLEVSDYATLTSDFQQLLR